MFNKKSQSEYFANLLKTLVVEAGTMARNMRLDAVAEEKDDMSIVTTADLAVSELISGRLSNFLERDDHILIDEKTVDKLPPMDEVLAKDYQWVLDPIDGTAPFFAGLPFYGVSLGLMKKGEPWLGAVYLPELDDLFWTDGKGNVMRQRGAKGASTPKALKKSAAKLFKHAPIFNSVGESVHLDYSINTTSAIVNGVMLCHSNAAGSIAGYCIWDDAAILAMYKTLSLKIECAGTGQEISKLDSSLFEKNWRWSHPYIAALPENIDFIKTKFEYQGATKEA